MPDRWDYLRAPSRSDIEALTNFGQSFGMTFQIFDDILDLIGTDESLGKPAGHDLVEGIYTLPVIRALAMPSVEAELRALLGAHLDTPTRDKAREIIISTDAVVASLVEARMLRRQGGRRPGRTGPAQLGPQDVVQSLATAGPPPARHD